MKRKIAILAPTILLTILFVGRPPRNADSQPMRVPPPVILDTTPYPVQDTGIATRLDTINMKAAILKEKTGEIRQGSIELERATRKLLQEVKKDKAADDPAPTYIVKQPDTIVVKDSTCVFVHDNSLDKKTWWGKQVRLWGQCTIHKKVCKLFKRKK